jgi:hypothetical protein
LEGNHEIPDSTLVEQTLVHDSEKYEFQKELVNEDGYAFKNYKYEVQGQQNANAFSSNKLYQIGNGTRNRYKKFQKKC